MPVFDMSGNLGQRDILVILDQRQDLGRMGFDMMRTLVASLRTRLVASNSAPALDPSDRR